MTSRRILGEIRDLRAEAGRRDERANELMADNRELMAEIRSELALSRTERTEAIAFYREQRREMGAEVQLTREVIHRNELAFQQNSRVLSELVETVREMKEEVRAQTRAIFKMIDRLDGGTAAA